MRGTYAGEEHTHACVDTCFLLHHHNQRPINVPTNISPSQAHACHGEQAPDLCACMITQSGEGFDFFCEQVWLPRRKPFNLASTQFATHASALAHSARARTHKREHASRRWPHSSVSLSFALCRSLPLSLSLTHSLLLAVLCRAVSLALFTLLSLYIPHPSCAVGWLAWTAAVN